MDSRPRTRLLILAVLVFLAAFGLRLYRLGADSLWYDESVSVYLASLNLPDMVAHTAGDIHPPFYYALLHLWTLAAGRSELSTAYVSLLFGILTIALTQRLARELVSPSVAWLAALLAATSPFSIWYSQEVRMYTLGSFLALLSTYAMVRLLEGHLLPSPRRQGSRWRWWVVYVASAASGIYSLYYFLFVLLFHNLYAASRLLATSPSDRKALFSRADSRLYCWASTQVALLFLYLPWLPVAWRQATQPPVPPWRSAVALWDVLVESWTALSAGQSGDPDRLWAFLGVFLFCYALGLRQLTTRRPDVTPADPDRAGMSLAWLLAGYTFVPLAAILLISAITPLYHVRYLFTYSATFAIVIAAGLERLRRWRPTALVLALTALAVPVAISLHAYYFSPAYAADDHRAAVRYLADRWRPGDAVLINAGYVYPAVLYYYDGDIAWRGRLRDYQDRPAQPGAVLLQTGSIGGSPQLGWGSTTSDFYATTASEMQDALDRVARLHPRLWVYRCYDTVTDPNEVLRQYLDQHYLKLDDVGFAGSSYIRVQLYQTTAQAPSTASIAHPTEGPDLFGSLVRLLGSDLQGIAQAGQPLYVSLYWQAQRQLDADLKAFVTLRNDAGIVAQWDGQPVAPLYPSRRWPPGSILRDPWRLDVPLGLPPGEYRLAAGLYNPTTGQRLGLLTSNGSLGGTEANLGLVKLAKASLPVDVARLPIQHRTSANLGDQVELLGFSLDSERLAPGQTLQLTLFWRALTDITEDYTVFVQLLDQSNKPWAATDVRPWGGAWPTAHWRAGEVVRDTYNLTLAPDAPDAEYRLVAGLYRTADRRRLPLSGLLQSGDSVSLATLKSYSSPRSFTVPPMQHRLDFRLGANIALLGYDVDDGQSITLYWQCLGPVDKSYTVFLHVLDAQSRLQAQHDSVPGDGSFPTTGWLQGQVVTDRRAVAIDPQGPLPSDYRLVVGLYDAASGQRLPVYDATGRPAGDAVELSR